MRARRTSWSRESVPIAEQRPDPGLRAPREIRVPAARATTWHARSRISSFASPSLRGDGQSSRVVVPARIRRRSSTSGGPRGPTARAWRAGRWPSGSPSSRARPRRRRGCSAAAAQGAPSRAVRPRPRRPTGRRRGLRPTDGRAGRRPIAAASRARRGAACRRQGIRARRVRRRTYAPWREDVDHAIERSHLVDVSVLPREAGAGEDEEERRAVISSGPSSPPVRQARLRPSRRPRSRRHG